MSISISVIIPTHNRPLLLKRAISSVMNQTEPVDEIIVVDDTNSSATKELIDSLNISNIKYIKNSDKGASSSRNLGAAIASSSFLAFLDDDDEWLNEKIELQKRLILEENLDACFSRMTIKYEDVNIEYSTKAKMPLNPCVEICLENFIGGTIGAIIRRDVFVKINGFDTAFSAREEYDLWIRLIHNGSKINIIEKALTVAYLSFNKRARISSSIKNYEIAMDLLNTKYKNLIEDELTIDQKKARCRRQYEFLAAKAISIGLRTEAVKYYFKSLGIKFSFKIIVMVFLTVVHPVLLIRLRSIIS
jgi:glycosyltransferase involved in cell wall biosynthesis